MRVFGAAQLVTAQKANTATLFALANHAFEGFEKLIELNTQAVRSALANGETYWCEALLCNAPDEFLARRTGLMQSAAEQALAYSHQLAEILFKPYADWMKAVGVQYENYTSTARSLVEEPARNVPAGTEITTSMMKPVFPTASSPSETVRKAAEQVIKAAKNTRAVKQ
ncbi:TIGR01841 family phasin [Paraburkholderia mimosarum]|uniref:TIGR01841 family phasin n=1 Tax=Paraburkholderia mimosarum TaxID=312026 RepID=UPI000423E525|nr:TIGR01841 family phasin [Paraburkholderia mimosarum]